MNPIRRLLLANKSWAQERRAGAADYFSRLAGGQKPEFLWISCSDSRVPESHLTVTDPGELFVHRNVANLVWPDDRNALSVIHYAIDALKVRHVIVCGHYGCGGVKASMSPHSHGPLDHWLRNIKDVYRLHRDELDALSPAEREIRLTELNVREQALHLTRMALIQESWRKRGAPWIHGWVYALNDGILREVVKVDPGTPGDPIYTFEPR